MIAGRKEGDIMKGPEPHIAIALHAEGYALGGDVERIIRTSWPELEEPPSRMLRLADARHSMLGDIFSKDIGNKVLHAFVIASREQGFDDAPEHIETCFNSLEIPTDEEIASITMGIEMACVLAGSSPAYNLRAMDRSNKRIVHYV